MWTKSSQDITIINEQSWLVKFRKKVDLEGSSQDYLWDKWENLAFGLSFHVVPYYLRKDLIFHVMSSSWEKKSNNPIFFMWFFVLVILDNLKDSRENQLGMSSLWGNIGMGTTGGYGEIVWRKTNLASTLIERAFVVWWVTCQGWMF